MRRKKPRSSGSVHKSSFRIPVNDGTPNSGTKHPRRPPAPARRQSRPPHSQAKAKEVWEKKRSEEEDASLNSPQVSSKQLQKAWEETNKTIEELLNESARLSQRKSSPSISLSDITQLDPWQKEAFDALQTGENVVIDAPTTAGKTRIVEAFFSANLHRNDFRACYTCPVKSLSNDKLREFRSLFGREYVGIATGDVKENIDAPIVVATLETYRNSLLGVEPDLGRHLVIFDEYHFIQDESRGSAWEEAMILTPPSCQILLLSASVANASDFAGWLQSMSRRAARLITVTKRPVPLVDLTWYRDHWYLPETLPQKALQLAARKKPANLPIEKLCERISRLQDWQLMPCIIYAGKRASCVDRAVALPSFLDPISEESSQKIQEALAQCEKDWRSVSFMEPSFLKMITVYGVVYHHSGLTPPIRLAVEMLVKAGLVRFCFATMGLSLGINFSVRSTLISDASRPGERGVTEYGASEVLQMTGRAGRRGKDVVGFSLWPSLVYYKRFAKTQRDDGFSNLRKDSTTFLGLISRGYSIAQIERVYAKSFLKYKMPKVDVTLLTADKLARQVSDHIPCSSPVHEFTAFRDDRDALCHGCPYRKKCHPILRKLVLGDLSRLHSHLHHIGALNDKDQLSAYGEIARLFPQNGGLLVAKMIADGQIHEGNLLKTVQLLASFSIAHYKKPGCPPTYQFPFSTSGITEALSEFYPNALFPEFYSAPSHGRQHSLFREFNSTAGFLIKEWAMGYDWQILVQMVVNEQFSDGDFTAIIYRVASYLQSFAGLAQTHPLLSSTAMDIRSIIMREPVTFLG